MTEDIEVTNAVPTALPTSSPGTPPTTTFAELGVREEIVRALGENGAVVIGPAG